MKKYYQAIIVVLLFCIPLISIAAQSPIAPGAQLVTEYSSNLFYEGPTWDPVTGTLYFTTPNNSPYSIYRLEGNGQASVWMQNSAAINGTFLSNDGRLLTAEQDAREIVSYRIGQNGPEDARVLAGNASWNRPNDLCQTASGDIYFTGPDWNGSYQAVYHMAPDGTVREIITNLPKPNGIITSNDDSILYIADSDNKNWMAYPINSDGNVGQGSVFFNPDTSNRKLPDGMTIDEQGNLYLTGRGGLWIVSAQGIQLDFISIPETISNVTFGGVDGMTLYITCQNKVYSLANTVRAGRWSNPLTRGDVDGNGNIDIIDALITAQFYVGLNPANFNQTAADVDCDGDVSIIDALLIARYYVGLIGSFSC